VIAPRSAVAVTTLLVVGLCGLSPADETVIPSRTCRGLWIVPVSFGEGPDRTLQLVLDTGASRTTIDPDSIYELSGRRVEVGKSVRLRDGKAGPLQINKLKATVHELDHIGWALGEPIDGILGFPAFKKMLLTLDYPAEQIRIVRGALPAVDGRTVFEDVGKHRPYLALEIGGATIPVLVDSGSTSGLTLRESDPLSWEIEPKPLSAAVRFSEIRLEQVGRLGEDVDYGPLILSRPVVEIIAEGTRVSGVPLMRRFVWTFDQRRRRIRMIADSTDPIRSDPERGTGLALWPIETGYRVAHIFPDTPAEQAGMRVGDVIRAVDGVPVYERGCTELDDYDDRESVVMSVARGAETIDVQISIRVLVP